MPTDWTSQALPSIRTYGLAIWPSPICARPSLQGVSQKFDQIACVQLVAAGDINARYGRDPGVSFYTHISDQHGSFSSVVMSATNHEAPYVLDGLLYHGTPLGVGTHYTDTGGATDHVFILCTLLGIRFCPRLRDLPDRRLARVEPVNRYPDLRPLMGTRVKIAVVREHWADIVRLAASLKAGTVAPSIMLKKLSAYRLQNQLDLALQELGRIERTLLHARLAGEPGAAAALSCRPQQKRPAPLSGPRNLHVQPGTDRGP